MRNAKSMHDTVVGIGLVVISAIIGLIVAYVVTAPHGGAVKGDKLGMVQDGGVRGEGLPILNFNA